MAHREFGELNFEAGLPPVEVPTRNVMDPCECLRNEIIGAYEKYSTPFGDRPIIYCDWIASGRCLNSLEQYMSSEVMSYYGNTHTTTSVTGHQSTCFRHEARQIIAESVNAKITGKASQDLVLFCGNGTTSAVKRLISCLGLQIPLSFGEIETARPIIFISKLEHHSNILPWRESCGLVIEIEYDEETGISFPDLEAKLIFYKDYKVKIGSFSAASNITGQLIDTDRISIMMHRFGGLAFFDYATAAPYVKIDMNPTHSDPTLTALAAKDAIFFSGHKFLGGPGSSGVLIVKKMIFPQAQEAPSGDIGGGTVFYVTSDYHRFLSNREEREEGGTPSILGDIKLGLVLHSKGLIGASWIELREFEIYNYVAKRLESDSRIVILGGLRKSKNLPIFSFLVRSLDRFLHFHFVCALLNDLFGIQCRGGCMCAGPFAQLLLGITQDANQMIESALLDKHEVLRPGFTRVSFPYWLTQSEIDFIVDGILFVAEHGPKFLRQYRYNPKTGEWAHSTRLTRFPERNWLSNFRFGSTKVSPLTALDAIDQMWKNENRDTLLKLVKEDVARILNSIEVSNRPDIAVGRSLTANNLFDADSLRWFVVAEDFKNNFYQNVGCVIAGPLCPSKLHGNFLTSQGGFNGVELTAYAIQRDAKLMKRNHDRINIPRFLLLFYGEDTATPLRDLLWKNMTKFVNTRQTVADSTSASSTSINHLDLPTKALQTKVLKPDPAIPPVSSNCGVEECSTIKKSSGPGYFFPVIASAEPKFVSPPKKIMKLVGQAIKEWGMIQDGDKLLLGLSGGKDSLALLHILKALQKRAPIKFEISCATVDPQTSSFDPSPLIPYVQSLGVPYHYLSEPIVELAKSKMQGDSLCAFCSRFKRGLLYSCCRTYGYNKLVLAQHLDDLAESFFMSLLHNGQVRTMKANYSIDAGDVRVIRPLCYVRETATRDFSQNSAFPIINENCPACFEEPKERARVKKLLSQEEAMVPSLFYNMRKALLPLMHEETYEAMHRVTQLVEEAGYKETDRRKDFSSKRGTCSASQSAVSDSTDLNSNKRSKIDFVDSKSLELRTSFEEVMNGEVECIGDYCAPCFEIV